MEKFNEMQKNPEDKKSGFGTCTWIIGATVSVSGALIHGGRSVLISVFFVC